MKLNLKQKLILSSSGLILLFGIATAINFESSIARQKSSIQQSYGLYLETLEASVSRGFLGLYSNVQGFTRNSVFSGNDKTQIEFVLNELVSLYTEYDAIVLVDKAGKVIASNAMGHANKKINSAAIQDMDLAHKDWFQPIANKKLVEDLDKGIFGSYVSQLHYNDVVAQLYGEPRYVQIYAAPIDDGFGSVKGYLIAFANARWMERELNGLAKGLTTAGKAFDHVMLSTREGQVLGVVHLSSEGQSVVINGVPELSRIKKQLASIAEVTTGIEKRETGVKEGINPVNDAPQSYMFYNGFQNESFVTSLGWVATIVAQEDSVFQEIASLRKQFYGIFSVLLLFFAFFGWWQSDRIEKSLAKFVEMLTRSLGKSVEATNQLDGQAKSTAELAENAAGAIVETSSTLEEIRQTTAKSLKSAEDSLHIAGSTEKEANRTRDIMDLFVESRDIMDLFVERAFVNYNIMKGLSLTFGRLPTLDGPPQQFYDGTPRQGAYPKLAYLSILDGYALTYGLNLGENSNLSFRYVYTPLTTIGRRTIGSPSYSRYTQAADSRTFASSSDLSSVMIDFNMMGLSFARDLTIVAQMMEMKEIQMADIAPVGTDMSATVGAPAGTVVTSGSSLTIGYQSTSVHVEMSDIAKTGVNVFATTIQTTATSKGLADKTAMPIGFNTNKASAKTKGQATLAGLSYALPVDALKNPIIGFESFSSDKNYFNVSMHESEPFDYLMRGKANHIWYTQPLHSSLKARVGLVDAKAAYAPISFGDPVASKETLKSLYVQLRAEF